MFIFNFFLFINSLLDCTYLYNSSLNPETLSKFLSINETLCINSSIRSTAYSIFDIPHDFIIEFREKSTYIEDLPIKSTLNSNFSDLIYFTPHKYSIIIIRSLNKSGNIGISYISLEESCSHGLFITNTFNSIISTINPKENIPSKLFSLQNRCFFLTGYQSNISLSIHYTLSLTDDFLIHLNNDIKNNINIPNTLQNLYFNNSLFTSSYLIKIKTSSTIIERDILIESNSNLLNLTNIKFNEFFTKETSFFKNWIKENFLIVILPILIFLIILIISFIIIYNCLKNKKIENDSEF